MSQITITLIDRPGNRVEVKVNPLAQTLIEAAANGHTMTSAEGYALLAIRAIREESQRMQQRGEKGMIIQIPRLKGRNN